MANTKFSVVIIAYKRKEYLINAVNSVLNQKYPSEFTEIIVVKSFQDVKIDQFLLEKQIKSIYTESKSIGKKFALGFEICRGDIICLLEDDDEFHELKMSTIADVFEKDPDIDVFVNGYEIVNSEEKLVNVNYFRRNREFQSTQPLLKLNSKNYDPKLFDLLNLYFNNSRF